MTKYDIFQPMLMASLLVIGIVIGVKTGGNNVSLIDSYNQKDNASNHIGRVEEILRFIESRYVDSLDIDDVVESAIYDVMDELDPHSLYLSPEQLREVSEQMDGNYRGVGVESFFIEDTVRISRVLKNTPAEKAGIQPLDKVLNIDKVSVAGQGMKYSAIRDMLRAEGKESISLNLLRGNEIIETSISPEKINLQSSKIAYTLKEGVGYIKVDRFSSNTYKEFMEGLEILAEKEEIKHLVIDLRDNPGGYLPEAINILSQLFDEKEKLLVYTEGKSEKKLEYKTTGKNFFPLDKIAVLINESSASGSEIIAGAIQDWDRGVIIGRRSYGKGLVQEQYPLRNGGAIRLTISRYYTPSGRSIQRPYDDLSDYQDDIETRFASGELYDLDKYLLTDSTEYKTMNLARSMYGGGGIIPDVYIPLHSTIYHDYMSYLEDYIPEYVFQNREKGWTYGKERIVVDEFLDYVEKKNPDIKNRDSLDRIELIKRIRSQLAYQELGELEREKVLNESDPFIEEALKYTMSPTEMASYIEIR